MLENNLNRKKNKKKTLMEKQESSVSPAALNLLGKAVDTVNQ